MNADYIRALVSKAAMADRGNKVFGAEKHKYKLNPPISMEKVREFEEKYRIKLPDEYVFFLTEVGNGGAGPYYGLYPLEKLTLYNPFLEKRCTNGKIEQSLLIDKNLTIECWNRKMEVLEDDDKEYESIYAQVIEGILIIGTQGCTYDNLLMYRGSEAGKMVYIDWNLEPDYPPFFTHMTFLEWYTRFFEEIIAEHNMLAYGYRKLGTEEELM